MSSFVAGPVMIAVLATMLADLILRLTWSPWYFSRGAPLYRRDFAVNAASLSLPSDTRLQASLGGGIWPRMAFRKLSTTACAFSETFPGLIPYFPIMRGMITLDARSGVIRVVGYVNWAAYAALIFFVGVGASRGDAWMYSILAVGLLLLNYALQAVRYGQIVSSLQRELGGDVAATS